MSFLKLLRNITYRLDKYIQTLRKYIKTLKDILSYKHCILMLLYDIKETTTLDIKLCSQSDFL